MTMQSSNRPPKRRETRSLPPFATADDALEACRFAIAADAPLDGVDLTFVDRERLHEGIAPRFRLAVEKEFLSEVTGVALEDLRFYLAARDVASKRYRLLNSWAIANWGDPFEWTVDQDEALQSNAGFEFSMCVCLESRRARTPNEAYRKGSILAQRTFSVAPESDGISFPINFVDFGPTHWPDDAFWAVEYSLAEPNFSLPAADIFALNINQKVQRKLTQLARTPAGAILFHEITISVFCQVATRALQATIPDDPDASEGFFAQIVAALQQVSNEDPRGLARLAKEDPSEFRALVQQMYGIVPSIVGS